VVDESRVLRDVLTSCEFGADTSGVPGAGCRGGGQMLWGGSVSV